MHYVYIIYSRSLDTYYIGESNDVMERIELHNSGHFENSFTSKARDWKVHYELCCQNRSQARKIESHIKRMKSRGYIENLKKYPEIGEKLLVKYA